MADEVRYKRIMEGKLEGKAIPPLEATVTMKIKNGVVVDINEVYDCAPILDSFTAKM